MPFRKKIYLLFILVTCNLYAQLTPFTFTLTANPERCSGNGTLFFSVQNTAQGAAITYAIYRLPNTNVPIAITSLSSYSGLSAGNYQVVATQTLGSFTNSQQASVQVANTIEPLVYQLNSQRNGCFNANLTVAVSSGNPVSYEIINGPLVVPPQSSNYFPNLPPGIYTIRVNDDCGDGIVQTFTVNYESPPNLYILGFSTTCALVNCSTLEGSLSIQKLANSSTAIRYPLTVQWAVTPPGGGAVLSGTQLVNSGAPDMQGIPLQIPYFDSVYTCSFTVVDACGNVYTLDNFTINKPFSASLAPLSNGCFKDLKIDVCNYVLPLQVEFLEAPAGFNPSEYNGNHPGPFNSDNVSYISNPTNPIPLGQYTIKVTDGCGRVSIVSTVIQQTIPNYVLSPFFENCQPLSHLALPLGSGFLTPEVVVVEAPPSFTTQLPLDVSGQVDAGSLEIDLPPGSYTFEVVDSCGYTSTISFEVTALYPAVSVTPQDLTGCGSNGSGSIRISINLGATLQTVQMIAAPTGFPFSIPYDCSSFIALPSATIATIPNLPLGNYTFLITDSCGVTYTKTVTLAIFLNTSPALVSTLMGCDVGKFSLRMSTPNGIFETVKITAAPATFPYSLPYDISFGIASNGVLYINDLPEGAYTFSSTDQCGLVRTETRSFEGFHYEENSTIIPQCNAFSIQFNYTDNNGSPHYYWLQKWNPIAQTWCHPLTQVTYAEGTNPLAANSMPLVLGLNGNIFVEGQFRVLSVFENYNQGQTSNVKCVKVIKEFTYTDDLSIANAYLVNCPEVGTQVIINAVGVPPLHYSITSINGNPVYIDNGTSNIFSGLTTGLYNFTVDDSCGNIVNRDFDLGDLGQPTLTSSQLCEGATGQLTAVLLANYTYEWWNDADPTTILSTTNVLTFSPFSNTTSPGTYKVRLHSILSDSCTDTILTYTVLPQTLPNAGGDGILTVCADQITLNLFALLEGSYDAFGTWSEVANNGVFSGGNWQMNPAPAGSYVFTYHVENGCGDVDEATVLVQVNAPIPDLNLSETIEVCLGASVQLDCLVVPGASYFWSGPNGFTSALPNPMIDALSNNNTGVYTVLVERNGCERSEVTNVKVNPIPEFSIQQTCQNNQYTLTVIPAENSFHPDEVSYDWSGPGGFTATSNPIVITQLASGNYQVTVTNNWGCTSTLTQDVGPTICNFPSVITPNDDGANDNFDLTGFLVNRLEVFNRWGRKVFEQSNYTNQWQGQNQHGESLPDGVYYYFVDLQDGQTKRGWVMIHTGN